MAGPAPGRVGNRVLAVASYGAGGLILLLLAGVALSLAHDALPALTASREQLSEVGFMGGRSLIGYVVPLVSLTWMVITRGAQRFGLDLLTTTMRGYTESTGGVYHAIIGTVEVTALAAVFSVPLGILTAIFLVEYDGGALARAVTFLVDVMTGIPSIVAGLFAYSLFLLVAGPRYQSGLVGAVALSVRARTVTALIGPSGCGKSTFLRTLNRMHELVPGGRVEGEVLLDGVNLYDPAVDPVQVRRVVGMVLQRPTPFPSMSIAENVLAGVRLNRRRLPRAQAEELVESSLRGANLWEEVKDRLEVPGGSLSGGQQQRLCIARAIAVRPQVLLMDEPCSALDPISTLAVEELISQLKESYTIVIVTHNMQQALRVSDTTAFFNLEGPGQPGHLVEVGDTDTVFTAPQNQATQDYIFGRFG